MESCFEHTCTSVAGSGCQSNRDGGYLMSMIYFYLTEGCNLKCRHCWMNPKFQDSGRHFAYLDPALFRSIIRQGRPLGLTSVKLTGGEPLLHPELKDILAAVKDEGVRLIVESNGVLCTEDIARALKESCDDVFVSVSLDGVDAATHDWMRGVKGSFVAALEGIRKLVHAGVTTQIIMTLVKRNAGQIEGMVRLAESLGVESVKFNLLQPTERGEMMHEAGQALSIEELVRLGKWVESTLALSTSLRIDYGHPLAFRPLGAMFAKHGDGCGRCGLLSMIGVLPDGSYALCGIGESLPEMVFGHAARDSFESVWRESSVLNEIRAGMPNKLEGICAECLLKAHCLGSCIAQNYYSRRQLWAPFWFCEQAEASGLFPPSRKR